MELDFRYNQYNLNNIDSKQKEDTDIEYNKPYQEVIQFFDENKNIFYYNELLKIIKNITTEKDLVLPDNTKIKIVPQDRLVHIGINFPDGNKFIGVFSNISNNEEFEKALD